MFYVKGNSPFTFHVIYPSYYDDSYSIKVLKSKGEVSTITNE